VNELFEEQAEGSTIRYEPGALSRCSDRTLKNDYIDAIVVRELL
jgi:hypothetical protein